MVRWTRNRVVNFGEGFALPYVKLLVELDGQPYDQALYFKYLADAGIVDDVPEAASEAETNVRRGKRWDSYLGKIREFGLGFAVDEIRKGGRTRRSIWKASNVAKDLASGRLDFRQFMALQLTRFQLPRPSMPLQGPARTEIEQGVRVRPLKLILQTLKGLEDRNARVYLSRDEILRHLTNVTGHADAADAADAIIAARFNPAADDGNGPPPGQDYLDIWLNELSATGYMNQLRPGDESGLPSHIVVRGLPRFEEAGLLDELIRIQEYGTDEETINAYYDFLGSSPSYEQRQVLMMDARVVELEVPTEAQYSVAEGTLTGRFDIVGALQQGSLVVLVGGPLDQRTRSMVFQVSRTGPNPTEQEMTIFLEPTFLRVDGQPIESG